MASTASHDAEFFPLHVATIVEHTNVHFAARAPPTTVPKIAATGNVTVMRGGAFVTHGIETLWASLNFGADLYATNTVTNGLPDNPSQLGHIFRNDVGHLPDTPANRQLLVNTTNNPSNFAGKDRFGNDVYISTQSDGSQIWGYTRNGTIQNGGVNNPPKVWVDGHGLQ